MSSVLSHSWIRFVIIIIIIIIIDVVEYFCSALVSFQFFDPVQSGYDFLDRNLPDAAILPTHRKTNRIHVSSGIRTHGPRIRVSKDSSWLRPRGHRDLIIILGTILRRKRRSLGRYSSLAD
jgi:hypothetical protein